MPRIPRIHPDGGIHHVTNHRAGDDDLFLTERDRLLFLNLMAQATEETATDVLAYSLMGNHFHILVRTREGQLPQFMHYLQGNYARAFNSRHEHSGPVFRRRYHNVLVTTDEQFQLTIRYIHRNALELGYDITRYPWSDFPRYCGTVAETADLVNIGAEPLRSLFASAASYEEFVMTDMAHDKFSQASGRRAVAVGSNSSIAEPVQLLCELVSDLVGVDVSTIRASSRGRRNDARLVATLVANELFPDDAAEVGAELGYRTMSTFRTALTRARCFCDEDSLFADQVRAVRSTWDTIQHRAA